MEQILDAIVKAVSESPSLALWVLVIIYGYKVVVIGSGYAVIRFVVERIYLAWITPKHTLQKIDIEARLQSLVIRDCSDDLIAQIYRLRGKGVSIDTQYLHAQSVEWLRQAIDDKIAKDREAIKND